MIPRPLDHAAGLTVTIRCYPEIMSRIRIQLVIRYPRSDFQCGSPAGNHAVRSPRANALKILLTSLSMQPHAHTEQPDPIALTS